VEAGKNTEKAGASGKRGKRRSEERGGKETGREDERAMVCR